MEAHSFRHLTRAFFVVSLLVAASSSLPGSRSERGDLLRDRAGRLALRNPSTLRDARRLISDYRALVEDLISTGGFCGGEGESAFESDGGGDGQCELAGSTTHGNGFCGKGETDPPSPLSNFPSAASRPPASPAAIQEAPQPEPIGAEHGARSLIDVLEEREAVMKRDWTDTDFQDGSEANMRYLESYEKELMAQLSSSLNLIQGGSSAKLVGSGQQESPVVLFGHGGILARMSKDAVAKEAVVRVLSEAKSLGSALDLVGAYLKNYQIDKADAIMRTILPLCRERGKLWAIKALNFYAAIRAKQSRYQDSLDFLKELESILDIKESDKDAWKVFDMVYRNFGATYEGLGNTEEALRYFKMAMDVKVKSGKKATWFDLWDVGRVQTVLAFESNEDKKLNEAISTVELALELHDQEENFDKIMSAKILHTVGECYVALAIRVEDRNSKKTPGKATKLYKKALSHLKRSHALFKHHAGAFNPLTGKEAESVAQLYQKLKQWDKMKPYLLDALISAAAKQSSWGDGKADSVASIVDKILNAHRETEDREGLEKYFEGLHSLVQNAKARDLPSSDTDGFEQLVLKCAMVMVASGSKSSRDEAITLIDDAFVGVQERGSNWAMINALLTSLGNSEYDR